MLAKCNAPMLAGLRSVAHLGLSFNAIGCKLPSAACDWRRKALKSKREKHFHALPLVLLAAYGGEQTDDLHGELCVRVCVCVSLFLSLSLHRCALNDSFE